MRVELKARSDLSTESKYRSGSSKRLSPVPDEQSEAGGTEAAAGVARRREGDGEWRGCDGISRRLPLRCAAASACLGGLGSWGAVRCGASTQRGEERRGERRALQLATAAGSSSRRSIIIISWLVTSK